MTETASTTGAERTSALSVRVGLADRSASGRLWITGAGALDLLNRLSTNGLETLPDGTSTTTVLTNGDARVIDLLDIGAIDSGFWCLTSPELAQTVIDWLDMYTFGEDITVVDRTADTTHIAVIGPDAQTTLTNAGAAIDGHDLDQLRHASIAGVDVIVWRKFAGGADGYELIVDRSDPQAIIDALENQGAEQITQDNWEAYRVGNGMPVVGAEFGLFNNPLEARLLGAMSDTKGCYTGQEVIARLQTYKKVQRRLMAVSLTGPARPAAQLLSGKATAGQLTSVSKAGDRTIGLALISTKFAEEGAILDVVSEGFPPVHATLVEPLYASRTEPTDSPA
jgi:folate-binding protein YgfZ